MVIKKYIFVNSDKTLRISIMKLPGMLVSAQLHCYCSNGRKLLLLESKQHFSDEEMNP